MAHSDPLTHLCRTCYGIGWLAIGHANDPYAKRRQCDECDGAGRLTTWCEYGSHVEPATRCVDDTFVCEACAAVIEAENAEYEKEKANAEAIRLAG